MISSAGGDRHLKPDVSKKHYGKIVKLFEVITSLGAPRIYFFPGK